MEVFAESVSILDSISNQDSSTINSEILDSVLDEEPIATEQEIAEYQQQVDEELEQQQMLQDRFDRKSELRSWYVRKSYFYYIVVKILRMYRHVNLYFSLSFQVSLLAVFCRTCS